MLEHLASIYAKNKDSKIESERIEAEKAKAQLDAILAVRIATAGFWEMRFLTFLIAFPFALHSAAVGLDTTFGFGWGIAAYPPPFNEWEGAILLSFFGISAAAKVGSQFATALATRKR